MGPDAERVLGLALLALPDHAVAVYDRDGVITAWNDHAAKLTGVPSDAAIGRDLPWLRGPDGSDGPADLLARARREAVRTEGWRPRADGSTYWCSSTLFAVTAVDGRQVGFAEGFRDDTIGHQALIEQMQWRAMAAAARSVGAVAVSQDLDLRITWASGPPTTGTALSAEDVVGHFDDDFYPGEVAAFLAARKQRVIETGELDRFDVTVVGDDGPRVLDIRVSALRAAAGSIIGVVTVGVDVTEQRASEALLSASEARLARAEEIARIGSWEWDMVTGDSTWSGGLYALYDLTPKDQQTRRHPLYDRVHPQDLARVRTVVERASASGGSFTCDHRVLLPGGHVRFIRSRGEVTSDDAGNPVRMAGTVQDITERSRGPATKRGEDLTRVLTHRQLEVLTLVAEGMSNAEIAARLVISEATVKWHVRHVLRALGLTTRAQAAIRYLSGAE